MYAVIIDEDTIHFQVSLLTILLVGVLDECILQAVTCSLVPDHLAAKNLAESREYELQILVLRNRVQFSYKEHVLRWCDLGKRKIANHLKRERLCARLSLSADLLQCLWIILLFKILIVRDTNCGKLRSGWHRAFGRLHESRWVVVGIIQDYCVVCGYLSVAGPCRRRMRC